MRRPGLSFYWRKMRPTSKALVLGTGLALAAGFFVLRVTAVSQSHVALHAPKAPFGARSGRASVGLLKTGPSIVRLVAHGSVPARSLRQGSPAGRAPRRREHEH